MVPASPPGRCSQRNNKVVSEKTAMVNIPKKTTCAARPTGAPPRTRHGARKHFLQEQELVLPQPPVPVHRLRLFSMELLWEAQGGVKVVACHAAVVCFGQRRLRNREQGRKKEEKDTHSKDAARSGSCRTPPPPALEDWRLSRPASALRIVRSSCQQRGEERNKKTERERVQGKEDKEEATPSRESQAQRRKKNKATRRKQRDRRK